MHGSLFGLGSSLARSAARTAATSSAATRSAVVKRTTLSRSIHASSRVQGGGGNAGAPGTFTPPPISETHRLLGEGLMTMTFLWILYRFKEDGAVILGLRHPWDGHGDHHGDDHGHGDDEHHHAGHEGGRYEREEGFGFKPNLASE